MVVSSRKRSYSNLINIKIKRRRPPSQYRTSSKNINTGWYPMVVSSRKRSYSNLK